MTALLMPARLRALTVDGHLCANERALIPLLSKVRADVLKRGLLRLIGDCAAYPVAAIFAFARLGKIDWAAPVSIRWLLYKFADATVISGL